MGKNLINIEKAYEKQKEILSSFNGKLIGYKIGFSSTDTQKKFDIIEPAYGCLYDFMLGKGNYNFSINDFIKPLIEIEIAFKLSANINEKITEIDNLKKYIKSFYTAVELPDLRQNSNAFDIVADNIAAKLFILGIEHQYNGEDFKNSKAELYLNEKLVRKGVASNVLDSPLNALLWLSNKLISQGKNLRKGDIVLTGSFTEIFPAEKGNYKAIFCNPDEEIDFKFI